jgi:hypothetical protein
VVQPFDGVDEWHTVLPLLRFAGGRQDLANGRVRPFLPVSSSSRVSAWVVIMRSVRLDARVYSTFVDFDARAIACGPGTCLTGFNIDVVCQIEMTAGVVFVV